MPSDTKVRRRASGLRFTIRSLRMSVRINWLLKRPSWLRYEFHDGLGMVESGTLRFGVVQVKWIRLLSGYAHVR